MTDDSERAEITASIFRSVCKCTYRNDLVGLSFLPISRHYSECTPFSRNRQRFAELIDGLIVELMDQLIDWLVGWKIE